MTSHRCPDCQLCPACGRSAWCEGDRILTVPCEHHGYCGDCNVENCTDCRLRAEREMYESGDYDPRADPFIDHLAPVPGNGVERDGGYFWEGGWVDVPRNAT